MANNGERWGNANTANSEANSNFANNIPFQSYELFPSQINSFYTIGYQVPFQNTLPTNDLLPRVGWTRFQTGVVTNPLLKNYKILGFYGAAAERIYGAGAGAWF